MLFNKDKSELLCCAGGKTGSYSIPLSVINIKTCAFRHCSFLTSVIIPNSVTNIEEDAFAECFALTSIIIPNSVKYIGSGTFKGCSSLISINIPNSLSSIEDYTFWECTGLISINLPNSIKWIGNGAFYNCASLSSITIPNSIKTIGYDAFSFCSKLTNMTCEATEVPIVNEDVFLYSSAKNGTLYVPGASVDKYKTANEWRIWKYIVAIDNGYIAQIPCETPRITYTGEKINFTCSTEGATIHYSIYPIDNKSGTISSGEVDITGLYDVTAYATAEGKTQSEVVSLQIKCAAGVVEVEKIVEKEVEKIVIKEIEIPVEVIKEVEKIVEKEVIKEVPVEVEKIVEVHDTIYVYDDTRSEIILPSGNTIVLTITNGILNIEDAPMNSLITIYTVDGEMYETRRVNDKVISIKLPRNAVYIIKVGEKTFKVKI